MKITFTNIYLFMMEDLRLDGKTLLTFALILGLFKRKREPIQLPLRAIRDFSKASKSTVVASIRNLEEKKLISAIHVHGKRTTYSVSPDVMTIYDEFIRIYAGHETSPETVPVQQKDRSWYGTRTTTGSKTGPHIIKERNNKGAQTDIHVSDYRPSATIKKLTGPVLDSD